MENIINETAEWYHIDTEDSLSKTINSLVVYEIFSRNTANIIDAIIDYIDKAIEVGSRKIDFGTTYQIINIGEYLVKELADKLAKEQDEYYQELHAQELLDIWRGK
jgi:hypothetical protein